MRILHASSSRLLCALATAALAGGCGEAVTDPLRSAFRSDPAPVLGEWVTADFGGLAPELHEASIERGAGVLFGEFAYPLHGSGHLVQFNDALWNGASFVFTTRTDFGFTLADSTVRWTAFLVPGRGTRGSSDWSPPRLRLQAETVDGVAFQWDYLRPDDFLAYYGVETGRVAGRVTRRPPARLPWPSRTAAPPERVPAGRAR